MAGIASKGIYGAITQGTTSAQIVAGNRYRKRIYIQNTHATQDLHIGFDSGVTVANGWKLDGVDSGAAGAHSVCIEGYNGPIWADASGADTTGFFLEVGAP